MASNIKLQGNHIQHILDKILSIPICGGYTGTPSKEDAYISFQLTDGEISTNQSERIDIHYFWDYRLTLKNNLFTFPIVNRFEVNHIMKVLTEDQQKRILSYLGLGYSKCCGCEKEKDKYSYMVNYDRDKNYIQEEDEGMFSNFGEAWDYAHEEFVNEERRTGRITISLFIDNNNLTEIWKRPSLRKK